MTRATDFAMSHDKRNREELLGTNIEPSYSGVLSFVRRKYSRDLIPSLLSYFPLSEN